MRRTKIVCTIGPATESEAALRALIRGGMNLARLNFSHGTHAGHSRVIRLLRKLAKEMGVAVGIIQDLSGPKLRVGKIAQPPLLLKRGSTVSLTGESVESTEDLISIGSPEAIRLLHKNSRILLDDGKLELRVLETHREKVLCKVIRGGELLPHKGVNLPSVKLTQPALTEKDLADLAFGLKTGVDWIALSFVRRAEDLRTLRAEMQKLGLVLPIIAKIEKPQAIDHLDEIIQEADGVMVARGDLGIEMPLEKVPLLQKEIVEKCALAAKPVIVATQMLESMISSSRPTRAEVSDVANAILDGADAMMLSGETAVGTYPLQALEVMDRVAKETEKMLDYPRLLAERTAFPCATITDAISQACAEIANDLKVAAIIPATASGHTAAMISRLRPRAPLLGVTHNERTYRKLTLWWGVYPVLARRGRNTDEMIDISLEAAKAHGFACSGEKLVITAGVSPGVTGQTNLIKVETVK